MKIFIAGNVPSLKNSRVMTKRGIFHSKTVSKYLQKIGVKSYSSKGHENYKTRPNLFEAAVSPMKNELSNKKPPYLIGMYFIRDSKRRFDWINAAQIICDLLVAHAVIPDDCMDYLIPSPFMANDTWYGYDKENPGVIIDY